MVAEVGKAADRAPGASEVACGAACGLRLTGDLVTLRPAEQADIPALAAIRAEPEVYRWWRGGPDLEATIAGELAAQDEYGFVIEYQDRVAGYVQWWAQEEPDYRHAGIDI